MERKGVILQLQPPCSKGWQGTNNTTISWKLQEKKKVKGRRKLTRLQLKEEVEGNLKEIEKGEIFAEDCVVQWEILKSFRKREVC